jgi:hydroxymethylpyrimidine pyrophosphatase-like HAD family hydrolase
MKNNKIKIKLFVFDWDGTALGGHDPYDRFPPLFSRFLDELSGRGISWATNTTWAVETQIKVIKESGVKSCPAFLAGSTGRVLVRVKGRHLIPDRCYKRLIMSSDRSFKRRFGPALRRISVQLFRDNLIDQLYFNPYGQPSLTVVFSNDSAAGKGWRLFQPLISTGMMYRMSGKGNADSILPSYMNKGAVIRHMQRSLGLTPAETMVAGDGWNDRHMFDPGMAKWIVCPANANPAIKALVRKNRGVVGRRCFSWGVMEAANKLMRSRHDF